MEGHSLPKQPRSEEGAGEASRFTMRSVRGATETAVAVAATRTNLPKKKPRRGRGPVRAPSALAGTFPGFFTGHEPIRGRGQEVLEISRVELGRVSAFFEISQTRVVVGLGIFSKFTGRVGPH